MNPHHLRRLFPNASKAVLAANATDYGPNHPTKSPLPNPEPECHEAPALGAAVQGKATGDARVVCRFVGFRVRPLDPDNFAGSVKDLLDGLRHAGIICGDEPWRIRLETEQEKVAHFQDERTEIEITIP